MSILENTKEEIVDMLSLSEYDELEEIQELQVEVMKGVSKAEQGEKGPIKYFSGSRDNKWLSSFNKGEPFEYEGYTYPTVEHAFQAQKIDPKDPKEKEYKTKLTDKELKSNQAKKLGGKKSFKENKLKFRKDWDKVKLEIMEEINGSYYKANPKLAQKLVETGSKELLHTGFRIDKFWGQTKAGGGNNHGKILMEIRESYKNKHYILL